MRSQFVWFGAQIGNVNILTEGEHSSKASGALAPPRNVPRLAAGLRAVLAGDNNLAHPSAAASLRDVELARRKPKVLLALRASRAQAGKISANLARSRRQAGQREAARSLVWADGGLLACGPVPVARAWCAGAASCFELDGCAELGECTKQACRRRASFGDDKPH